MSNNQHRSQHWIGLDGLELNVSQQSQAIANKANITPGHINSSNPSSLLNARKALECFLQFFVYHFKMDVGQTEILQLEPRGWSTKHDQQKEKMNDYYACLVWRRLGADWELAFFKHTDLSEWNFPGWQIRQASIAHDNAQIQLILLLPGWNRTS